MTRERELEDALERARWRISELEAALRDAKQEVRTAETKAGGLEWKAREHDRAEAQRARSYDRRDPFSFEESVKVLLDDYRIPTAKSEFDRVELVLLELEQLRGNRASEVER